MIIIEQLRKNLALVLKQHSFCDQMIDQKDDKLNKFDTQTTVYKSFNSYAIVDLFSKGKDC